MSDPQDAQALHAPKFTPLIDALIVAAWQWGESCGIDNIGMKDDGDSHNQWKRGDTIAAARKLAEALAALTQSAPQAAPQDAESVPATEFERHAKALDAEIVFYVAEDLSVPKGLEDAAEFLHKLAASNTEGQA